MAETNVHVFGIRHHGPGSARSLRQALEALRPDAILVEGPPDAAEVLPLLTHAEMKPPVALLVYQPADPSRAVYYPFALFSPEWQALHFGLTRKIPVRFMDLPQAHRLAMLPAEEAAPGDAPAGAAVGETDEASAAPAASEDDGEGGGENEAAVAEAERDVRRDPLGWLAEAAGYSDGERWWEHLVEHRRDSADLFAGIREAMGVLRESVPPSEDPIEPLREAYMRQCIRAAQSEGFERIAVVCGAWHAPVLAEMPAAKEDAALLKGLTKVKTQSTWVPWTHGRLSYQSGYGAGIESPGWYHHLWTCGDRVAVRWMTRVARLLREKDLDASSAHVIEAVRLAESLAAIRDRPLPGLPEMTEAARATFCFDSDLPMQLVHDRLVVGEVLGGVPDDTPMVPLQQDLAREQKRLRFAPSAAQEPLKLDLRQEGALQRSHLLHRLGILGIPWGREPHRPSSGEGTFWEIWQTQWLPEFAVLIIEAAIWGNTVPDAATARARDLADHAPDLPALVALLRQSLWADLPDAIGHLMGRVQAEAAVASDVSHLMGALPEFASILRYSDVRRTDVSTMERVVSDLVARICVGLPGACASLNDEAAAALFDRLITVNAAILLLQNDDYRDAWRDTLRRMADRHGLHGLLAGRCCRLLLDGGVFTSEECARRMGLALSLAGEPAQAAAWVEGFLKGSGALLLHDEALWQVVDEWVTGLSPDAFAALLPLVRRTFATFPAPERRRLGERVRSGQAGAARPAGPSGIDTARAERVLPLVAQILGLPVPEVLAANERK